MLDESLLDAPDALARADTRGLLRGTAEAGARVRTAVRQADESGLAALRPEGRPRGVLVAGPGPATSCAADLLGALAHGALPVTLIRPTGPTAGPRGLRWTLPGWAGPVDLLLLTSADGTEPGLPALAEQAYRRGCTVVSVAPAAAPLSETTRQVHGLAMPFAAGTHLSYSGEGTGEHEAPDRGAPGTAPGTLWGLLVPLIALADRLQLFSAPPSTLQSLADRLDRVAERCGPAIATYSNPAKTLATELAGALPLLWTEGPLAGAVGRHCATTFAALAGRPALAAELPEALTLHRALLAGAFAAGADPDDFFRDRVEEPEALRARVLLLRERAPLGDSGTIAARELAFAHDTQVSELEPAEGSGPLQAAAELLTTMDFAAVYLALASTGQ